MMCPWCHGKTKVTETRTRENGGRIYRRRKCLDCDFRYSTIEVVNLDSIVLAPEPRDGPHGRFAEALEREGFKA